jgi:tetratricopeptide (TPR) repeat protein
MKERNKSDSIVNFFKNITTKQAIWIIIVVGFIVFFNSFFNGFVADDQLQIVQNRTIQSLSNLPSFFSGGTFSSGEERLLTGVYYKPLLNIAYAINYALGNGGPFLFHLFQVTIYIVNACLLFLFFKGFFKNPLALFLSLIFLVHPINSEVAFYIADTQDVLFFFFGIVSLCVLLRDNFSRTFVVASMLLLLSLLSKETGFLFLLVALFQITLTKKEKVLTFLGYLSAVVILYVILRTNAIGVYTEPYSPIALLDFKSRLINIPSIIFFYLKTFFFPKNLAISYQQIITDITFNNFFLPLLVDVVFLSILGWGAMMFYRRYSRKSFLNYIFFLFWFIIGIGLHLQILPLDVTVAERWFYFPFVGLLGMGGMIYDTFRTKMSARLTVTIGLLILTLLSTKTFIRSFDWRDFYILLTRDSMVSKDDYNIENALASELIKQKKWEEAMVHAEKSVMIHPNSRNYNNLGITYFSTGDYKQAEEAYLKALKYGDFHLAYENLASLYMVYGNQNENIVFLENAISKYPSNARLLTPLAVLYYENDQDSEAKEVISRAYKYSKDPQVVGIYNKIMSDLSVDINFTIE